MREEGWRRFGLYVWDQGPGLPGDWNGRLAPSFELVFHFNKISRRANKTLPKLAKSICLGHGSKLRDPDGTLKPVVSPEASLQPNKIPDNVIRVVRQKGPIGQGLDHPAVFPVDFAQFVIDAFTASQEIVYEPFCGSGSTVIAGEKLGRRVFAIEIEPAYVDVAVERWERFTGRKAVRHGAIDQTG
jgi:DNA modification methylase